MRAFGVSIFSGAFLLFLVQPLIARLLTPAFGGSASVWVCCLVFFQAMLVLGYGYSHVLVRKVRADRQGRLHSLVGLAALASLALNWAGWGHPLLAGWATRMGTGRPLVSLLLALAGGVGLPFLWLSATSPLVQSWFSRAFPEREPYRLYALSNAGSFLGLLSFPFFLEPWLGAKVHGAIFAAGLAALWIGLSRLGARFTEADVEELEVPAAESHPEGEGFPFKPSLVLGISAVGTILFMAITVQLTSQLGNTPLLWVLPFGLYLVSFILPFEGRAWVRGRAFQSVMAIVFLLVLLSFLLEFKKGGGIPVWIQLGLLAFTGCTLVHTYLFTRRPASAHLTLYYLCLAMGGSLGGLFVGVVSPLIYNRIFELPISILLVSVVMIPALIQVKVWKALAIPVGMIGVIVGGSMFAVFQSQPGKYFRDFYGTYELHRLEENGHSRLILNNSYTVHGSMDLRDPLRPSAYFGVNAGFGRAMAAMRSKKPNLRIGLVGLGAGNSVLYGRKGDEVVVYEISSQVLEIAGPKPLGFPFVASSEAKVEIVEGDARIRMQEELSQGSRQFDILLVDAFSGGNIPWHLLTTEALRLYQRHLKEDGLLVVHLTNRLPLDRVVAITAQGIPMNSMGIYHPCLDNPSPLGFGDQYSQYVILSRRLGSLIDPALFGASSWLVTWKPLEEDWAHHPEVVRRVEAGHQVLEGMEPWTDARCSVFPLLFKARTTTLLASARRTQANGVPAAH